MFGYGDFFVFSLQPVCNLPDISVVFKQWKRLQTMFLVANRVCNRVIFRVKNRQK